MQLEPLAHERAECRTPPHAEPHHGHWHLDGDLQGPARQRELDSLDKAPHGCIRIAEGFQLPLLRCPAHSSGHTLVAHLGEDRSECALRHVRPSVKRNELAITAIATRLLGRLPRHGTTICATARGGAKAPSAD